MGQLPCLETFQQTHLVGLLDHFGGARVCYLLVGLFKAL